MRELGGKRGLPLGREGPRSGPPGDEPGEETLQTGQCELDRRCGTWRWAVPCRAQKSSLEGPLCLAEIPGLSCRPGVAIFYFFFNLFYLVVGAYELCGKSCEAELRLYRRLPGWILYDLYQGGGRELKIVAVNLPYVYLVCGPEVKKLLKIKSDMIWFAF